MSFVVCNTFGCLVQMFVTNNFNMEIETLTFIRDSDTIFVKLTGMPEVYINKSDGYFYSIANKKLLNQIVLTNLVKILIDNYENGKYKDIVLKRLSQQN